MSVCHKLELLVKPQGKDIPSYIAQLPNNNYEVVYMEAYRDTLPHELPEPELEHTVHEKKSNYN